MQMGQAFTYTLSHCHISTFPRRVEDGIVIPVVQCFGMTVHINNGGSKGDTVKSGAVIEMIEIFCLRQLKGSGMCLLVGFGICGSYQLFFAIAMKSTGLPVGGGGTDTEINHLSKLGKEKDKESQYGKGLFHACCLKDNHF